MRLCYITRRSSLERSRVRCCRWQLKPPDMAAMRNIKKACPLHLGREDLDREDGEVIDQNPLCLAESTKVADPFFLIFLGLARLAARTRSENPIGWRAQRKGLTGRHAQRRVVDQPAANRFQLLVELLQLVAGGLSAPVPTGNLREHGQEQSGLSGQNGWQSQPPQFASPADEAQAHQSRAACKSSAPEYRQRQAGCGPPTGGLLTIGRWYARPMNVPAKIGAGNRRPPAFAGFEHAPNMPQLFVQLPRIVTRADAAARIDRLRGQWRVRGANADGAARGVGRVDARFQDPAASRSSNSSRRARPGRARPVRQLLHHIRR